MSRDVFVNECVQYYRYTLTHIGIHCVGRVLMVQLLFFWGGGGLSQLRRLRNLILPQKNQECWEYFETKLLNNVNSFPKDKFLTVPD